MASSDKQTTIFTSQFQEGKISPENVKELSNVKKANLMEIKKPKELIEQEKKEKSGFHLPLIGRKSQPTAHIEIKR